MQHHPGSWYLPWGVPLQKMVAVPIHPSPLQLQHPAVHVQPMLTTLPTPLTTLRTFVSQPSVRQPQRKVFWLCMKLDKCSYFVTFLHQPVFLGRFQSAT